MEEDGETSARSVRPSSSWDEPRAYTLIIFAGSPKWAKGIEPYPRADKREGPATL